MKRGVRQPLAAAWKRQAVESMAASFSGKMRAAQGASEAELIRLHAKIGQLAVERDFLSKACGR